MTVNGPFPPEAGTSLKLTSDEADALMQRLTERLHAEGETTTADVAEAMRVPEPEVRALLTEMRARRHAEAAHVQILQRAKRREKRVWLFAGLAALVLAAPIILQFSPRWTATMKPEDAQATFPATDVPPVGVATAVSQPVQSVAAGPAHYQLEIGEIDYGDGIYGTPQLVEIAQRLSATVENRFVRDQSRSARPHAEDERTLNHLKAGVFDAPSLEFREVNLRWYKGDGTHLSVERISMPFYTGDDAQIERIVRHEREQRCREMAKKAIDLRTP